MEMRQQNAHLVYLQSQLKDQRMVNQELGVAKSRTMPSGVKGLPNVNVTVNNRQRYNNFSVNVPRKEMVFKPSP